MTPFKEHLHRIRVEAERARRTRRSCSDQELGIGAGFEVRDEVREAVLDRIEKLFADLRGEVPAFELRRGFYEEKYALSLAAEEYRSSLDGIDKDFSRITFLLDPASDARQLDLTAKLTVRNRDLASARAAAPADRRESGALLAAFAEEQILRFARAWFAKRPQPEKTLVG